MAASFKVTLLAVGQGTCNMIEEYDDAGSLSNLILIDCGGDGIVNQHVRDCIRIICEAMEKRARASGGAENDKYLDLLVLSHQDMDHHSIIKYILENRIEGENYSIGKFYTPDNSRVGRLCDSYVTCVRLIEEIAGSKCVFVDGSAYYERMVPLENYIYRTNYMGLDCLYANAVGSNKKNAVSAVIELEVCLGVGNVERFLFPGDATRETMEAILDVELLESYWTMCMAAPHHGSIVTCDEKSLNDFLTKMNVAGMVVSAGKNNTHGHPHRAFMDIAGKKCWGETTAHYCYCNMTSKKIDRVYGSIYTTKCLYTTFIPNPTVRDQAVQGEYNHYVYTMSSSGMEESLEGIERHSGSPYTLTEQPAQENSRSWRAVAMPGMARHGLPDMAERR